MYTQNKMNKYNNYDLKEKERNLLYSLLTPDMKEAKRIPVLPSFLPPSQNLLLVKNKILAELDWWKVQVCDGVAPTNTESHTVAVLSLNWCVRAAGRYTNWFVPNLLSTEVTCTKEGMKERVSVWLVK